MKKNWLIKKGVLIILSFLMLSSCTSNVIVEKDLTPKSINDGKQPYEKITIPEVTELTLPDVISDNMMFEADKPIMIWGLTPSKEDITISLLDKNGKMIREKTIKPANDTSFITELKAVKPSFDEYTLEIKSADMTKQVKGILFGRVYLAGGQSNMDMVMKDIYNSSLELDAATNSNIRVYNLSINPCTDAEYTPYPVFAPILGGIWVKGDKQLPLKNVTAVGYLFAKGMYEKLNTKNTHIPIGVLSTSRGGTRIDTWLSRGAIEENTQLKDEMIKNKVYSNESNWVTEGKSTDFVFNQSSALYNMKIAPLTNMNISGLVWYQGETNVGKSMTLFAKQFDAFIKDFSKQFRYKEYALPSVIINIAPYPYERIYASSKYITGSAELIEIFNEFTNLHSANMVSVPIYDVSLRYEDATTNKNPIHPTDKIPVAKRAVELFYGITNKNYPPKFSAFKVDGNKITIDFENTYNGLMTKNNEPVKGFRICGEDRKFYVAEAVIVGKNQVALTSKDVPNPVAASYAFYNLNNEANLLNSKEIPIQIFRTDKNEYIHVK